MNHKLLILTGITLLSGIVGFAFSSQLFGVVFLRFIFLVAAVLLIVSLLAKLFFTEKSVRKVRVKSKKRKL